MAKKIEMTNGNLVVPDEPIVCLLHGDGTGPEIVASAVGVLEAAVAKSYDNQRRIHWLKLLAGQAAAETGDDLLPEKTLQAIREHIVALKGPMTTPVGAGYRSVNVAMRQKLDLYACIRPVKHYRGVPSPVSHPEKLDVVIFRENTEDVYSGIEFEAKSKEACRVLDTLKQLGANLPRDSAVGIKPVSKVACERLVARAVRYAIATGRKRITLVHKGNIMKYTEGAFRTWGYAVAREILGDNMVTVDQVGPDRFPPQGKILVQDKIADAMFQDLLLRPQWHEIIATTNLNGDYISDAAAAQVGGLGLAPGANIGDNAAVFEATHGSAPHYAGQDKVNPTSVILSGVMMLDHMGWTKAARVVEKALEATIAKGIVTYDLARQMENATKVSCSGFGQALQKTIQEV